jgi:hypothetical protein
MVCFRSASDDLGPKPIKRSRTAKAEGLPAYGKGRKQLPHAMTGAGERREAEEGYPPYAL